MPMQRNSPTAQVNPDHLTLIATIKGRRFEQCEWSIFATDNASRAKRFKLETIHRRKICRDNVFMPPMKKKMGRLWRVATCACLKTKKAIAGNVPQQSNPGVLRGMAAAKTAKDPHSKKPAPMAPPRRTTSAESTYFDSGYQLSDSSVSDDDSSTVVATQARTPPAVKKVRMALATPDPSEEPYDRPIRRSDLLVNTTDESSNPELTETSDPVDSYEALTADSMQVSEPYGMTRNTINAQYNGYASRPRTNLPSVAYTRKANEPACPQQLYCVRPRTNTPGTASDAMGDRGYLNRAASVVAPAPQPSTTQEQPRRPSVPFACSVGKGPYGLVSQSTYVANGGTEPFGSKAPPAAEACSASRPDLRGQHADSTCRLTSYEYPPRQPVRATEGRFSDGETATPAGVAFGYNVTVHQRARLLPAYADCLLYPLAVTLLGVAVGVIFMIAAPLNPRGWRKPSVCTSPPCTQNAIYLSRLLSWDDMSPCDDFYMFVCRRWTSDLAKASAEESVSADDDYAAALEERMHAMLRNESRASSLNVQVLGDLLEKCEDVKRIEDDGWNPFLEFMFDMSLDGFPMTPPVRQSLSVWKLAGKLLRRSGTVALLDVGVSTRPSTLSRDAITVGPPDVIGSAEGVDVNELMRLYTNAAFAAVNALKKDFVPPAYTIGIAKFAGELEKLFEVSDVSGSKVETLVTRSPLLDFLTEALSGLPVFDGAGSDVLILSPAFVSNVQELVEKTEPHTVINFLCVRLMIQTSAFLPSSGLTDFYGTMLYGKLRTSVPRRHLCVRVVERTLSQFFHYVSLVELNLHASATKYSDLVMETVNEFLRGIASSPYFNSASRVAIRALISRTRFKVLGPSWIKDNNAIERYAKNAPAFINQRALNTYLSLHEYAFVSTILRGPSQRWTLSAFATRCRYDAVSRTVYVPALLFNVSEPFDNRSANALHVPRVSTRLGRCLFGMLLSEAKSNSSRSGGGDGPSNQWLDRETRLRLREAQRCFEEHDDRQALEYLRDLLAARIAHQHFRRSALASSGALALRLLPRGADDEETLLSEDQLFFVYLVLQSCRRQSGDQKIVAPQHDSVGWNAVLRSYANFSDAFGCLRGSGMNPPTRCAK